jgi:predicted dehydrogenase
VFGSEPELLAAAAVEGPARVDVSTTALLSFGGVHAVLRCSMAPGVAQGRPVEAILDLCGPAGRLVATNLQAPQWGSRLHGVVGGVEIDEMFDVAGGNTYRYQLEAFTQIIAGTRAPLTGGADSIANMRALDAIYRATGLGPRG